LFFPGYQNAVFNAMLPALLGELWMMGWLLVKGARDLGAEGDAPAPALATGAGVMP
jgi:hypothetical protein